MGAIKYFSPSSTLTSLLRGPRYLAGLKSGVMADYIEGSIGIAHRKVDKAFAARDWGFQLYQTAGLHIEKWTKPLRPGIGDFNADTDTTGFCISCTTFFLTSDTSGHTWEFHPCENPDTCAKAEKSNTSQAEAVCAQVPVVDGACFTEGPCCDVGVNNIDKFHPCEKPNTRANNLLDVSEVNLKAQCISDK